MDILIIVLRIIHIVAGALWVGAAIFYFFFVEPTVKSLGPVGPKFMQDFIGKRRYPAFMNAVAVSTILAGAVLYWIVSDGFNMDLILSGPGLGFTLGAIAGIVVFFVGFFGLRPRAARMGALGREIGAAGGPPSDAQVSEMSRLEREMHSIERVDVLLLTVALILMATARYWNF